MRLLFSFIRFKGPILGRHRFRGNILDDGSLLDDIGTGGNPNYKLPHPQRKIVRRNGRRHVTRIQ